MTQSKMLPKAFFGLWITIYPDFGRQKTKQTKKPPKIKVESYLMLLWLIK